jgi:polysaccharide deacetylase family protein (PEP-CTERM system associated)
MVDSLGPLLAGIAAAGHEIACHGDRHQHIARLSPRAFRDDLRRAIGRIEDNLHIRPVGYRAPTFSVTRRTAWALDEIISAGFEYDSSIFPIRHDRYGVPSAPIAPFRAISPGGRGILELPPLTLDAGFARLPIGGGGYMRLFPARLMHRAIDRRLRSGSPAMLYLHPWELDVDQPRIDVGPISNWRHRVNLHTTAGKLDALLRRYTFRTAGAIADDLTACGALPRFCLSNESPDTRTGGITQ